MSNQGQREVCLSLSTSWAETDNGKPLKTRGYSALELSNLLRISTTMRAGGKLKLMVKSVENKIQRNPSNLQPKARHHPRVHKVS